MAYLAVSKDLVSKRDLVKSEIDSAISVATELYERIKNNVEGYVSDVKRLNSDLRNSIAEKGHLQNHEFVSDQSALQKCYLTIYTDLEDLRPNVTPVKSESNFENAVTKLKRGSGIRAVLPIGQDCLCHKLKKENRSVSKLRWVGLD